MDGEVSVRRTTQRPGNVRLATTADEDALFEFLMLAAEENALSPPNDEVVLTVIRKATQREGNVVGIIDAPDGTIAGSVGICMNTWWYTLKWHCQDMWCFVHPDYRRGQQTYARDLIQFAKWWADQLGMDLIMGVMSLHRAEGKVRLYRRILPFVGAVFLHRGGAA